MTQAGGPAALNGFLYQILHHLGWMAKIKLAGKPNGDDVKDACLVLEPQGGGDAIVEAPGLYVVEQYKTRSSGRPWSLLDLLPALRDLYRAVPPSLPSGARYRFVTNGRPGRLEALIEFLAESRRVTRADDLDNTVRRKFGRSLVGTNQEFFEWFAVKTVPGTSRSSEDGYGVAFHFFSRLDMVFCETSEMQARELEKSLEPYVPDFGDERRIRPQLVGELLALLSKGEAHLGGEEIKAMFRRVGLSVERREKLALLPSFLAERAHEHLRHLGYDPDLDVRGVPEWPDTKLALIISGESGSGKTWQLARLLGKLARDRRLAALVRVTGTSEDLLHEFAREVWQRGLGESLDKGFEGVVNSLRSLDPDLCAKGFVIAFDDVRDDVVARNLVRSQMNKGVRLVLTLPEAVAQSLEGSDSEYVHIHRVRDFSVEELQAYLRAAGWDWSELPSDLKRILRKPILAGMFTRSDNASFADAPHSEYGTFERFWERIRGKGRPSDEGIVLGLAGHAWNSNQYHLPRREWNVIGLDDHALDRLESSGWLREVSGDVMFAHDRLLNWAAAKWASRRISTGELSVEELGSMLVGEAVSSPTSRLGYVLMDVFWILSEEEEQIPALVGLLPRLEDCHAYGSYGETIYAELLPTLGERAIPVLSKRLIEVKCDAQAGYRTTVVGKGLVELARQEAASMEMEEIVGWLLNSDEREYQNVALSILAESPKVEMLDRLWEIHRARTDALSTPRSGWTINDYQSSISAIRGSVGHNPGWLGSQIMAADTEGGHLSELAHLLSALDHPDAEAIWKETSDVLVSKTPPERCRSVLNCAARFVDRELLSFAADHLSITEDLTGVAALLTLCALDPLVAVERLMDVDDSELYLSRDYWLPFLLHAEPDLTRGRLLELARQDAEGFKRIVQLFEGRQNEIGPAILGFVLAGLTRELRERFDECVSENPNWLRLTLRFLGNIADSQLLSILSDEAGGEFERGITKLALGKLPGAGKFLDDTLEGSRRVLIHIGGDGITVLLRKELESGNRWVLRNGLRWFPVGADPEVVEGVTRMAVPQIADQSDDLSVGLEENDLTLSTIGLAALGADEALVRIVEEERLTGLPSELAKLRAHRGRMSRKLTRNARRVLEAQAGSDESIKRALAVAWLSSDKELIGPVRAVMGAADVESEVAARACEALESLGDTSEEFARLSKRLLGGSSNLNWGLRALAGMGDMGAQVVAGWLREPRANANQDMDVYAIRVVHSSLATREFGVTQAVQCCRRKTLPVDAPFDIAVESGDPELRERTMDLAFGSSAVSLSRRIRAIQGLAKFDMRNAVQAIQLALREWTTAHSGLCRLLVEIAPESAGRLLLDASVSSEHESMRAVAGRCLRRLDEGTVSDELIRLLVGTEQERLVGAQVARYLPNSGVMDAMVDCASRDGTMQVRKAALKSLEHHRKERLVHDLLREFPAANWSRRWSLLLGILEIGDPHLLWDPQDALSLGKALSGLPHVFIYYADEVLRRNPQ